MLNKKHPKNGKKLALILLILYLLNIESVELSFSPKPSVVTIPELEKFDRYANEALKMMFYKENFNFLFFKRSV